MKSDGLVTCKVLFVCYGNTCRSPMAEAVFKNLLKQQNLEHKFEVDSAGISGWQTDQEPNDFVKTIMKRCKIPIEHRARHITVSDFSNFDYLVGMDNYNIRELNRCMDSVKSEANVVLLGDFNPDTSDKIIMDPYFDNREEDFQKCYTQIRESCVALLKHLIT